MLLRAVLMAITVFSLAACGSSYDVMGARDLANRGTEFHLALQTQYVDLAAAEKAEADWEDTKTFIQRARRAASGETFPPEAITARNLAEYSINALRNARARLMAVLTDQNRVRLPVMTAIAQSSFDCWMQEQEEDRQPEDIAACRSSFNTVLRALEAEATESETVAPAPIPIIPSQFCILFDFDSAELTMEALQVVDQISRAHQRYNPATVLVYGHTDQAGPNNYNLTLSRQRAEAVYDALAAKGIPQNNMQIEAYGEERPDVIRPDGTPEQRNRRVDVMFENVPRQDQWNRLG